MLENQPPEATPGPTESSGLDGGTPSPETPEAPGDDHQEPGPSDGSGAQDTVLVAMLTSLFVFILLVWGVTPSSEHRQYLRDAYPQWTPNSVAGDVGDRLILTPYIEAGDVEGARRLAAVSGGPFFEDIPSFSGFFTVNKDYNSNLYFWFFPAEQGYETAPLLLWLQGGPGASSLYGLFNEIGPFTLDYDDVTLVKNPYSWHRNHSIIFIDNPVGTGFSFTDDDAGYATKQVQVGEELYSSITQFLTVFSELQNVPFYITGESYAGKYVPALGYTIHQRNPTADLKVNLECLAVGNGLTDPITMLDHSDLVYQLGLVDTTTYTRMRRLEDLGAEAISNGELIEAYNIWSQSLSEFLTHSSYSNIFNFLYREAPQMGGNYSTFLQTDEVRRALHVGDAEYASLDLVYHKMIPDMMNSVKPWLEELIENYRVLYYNGQMDIIVAYALSVNMFNTLQFSAAEEYRNATRVTWHVDGELAGYMRSGGKFTEVLVRNAGHMVPTDQPKWAFDLINRFTSSNLVVPNKNY